MTKAEKIAALTARIRTVEESIDAYQVMGGRGRLSIDFAVFQAEIDHAIRDLLLERRTKLESEP